MQVYTNCIIIVRRVTLYFRRTQMNPIGFILLTILSFTTLAMADCHVWTETSTVRVVRESPPGATHSVHLWAARNEWVSFQILVRSDAPLVIQRIEPSEFKAKGGESIPSSNLHLFRQHQIHLTVGTERNDSFKPGWYPDPLIPLCNPLTGAILAGRLKALPFDLPANETHGFWIDIHVPSEAKPGMYRNTFRISAEGDYDADIPVELTVWDFQLPDTPTMQTAFGSPVQVMQAYYKQRAKEGKEAEPTDWPSIEKQCSKLMSEHRINAVPLQDYLSPRIDRAGGYQISKERIDALREFVDSYHVNALQAPNPADVFKDPDKDRDKFRSWLKAIDVAAERLDRPNVLFYFYLVDEPNDWETYDFIRKWGKAIHEAKSVVRVLVTESTKPRNVTWGNLYGAIDIWCPLFPEFDALGAARHQEHGETVWVYTALCQKDRTPWWHIDYPLLNYRVPAWIAWRYRISGLLYWGGMAHWNEVDDPWSEAWTYHHPQSREKVYNGEGTLVYPARAVGYDGIVPNLRLKALRDGIQDYEYLSILERLGLAEEARKIVLPLASSWFKWNQDPVAYEKARVKLAEMIVLAGAKK